MTTKLVLHSKMEAEMGVLGKLKIVALAPKAKASAEQDRRTKLIEQLDEQKQMVEGLLAGTPYLRTKQVWVDGEDGNRTRVGRPVRARQWWQLGAGGAVQFGLRYGAVPLELQPGKTDYAGHTIPISDPATGAVHQAQIFVAVAITGLADTKGPTGQRDADLVVRHRLRGHLAALKWPRH